MGLGEVLAAAFQLLAATDPQVMSAVGVSLRVSVAATLLAVTFGAPIGFLVATRRFRGRRTVELILNTLTAMPTVVVGLLTYTLLSRRGVFGPLGLLYTQTAMVIGETLLVTPLMAALTVAVVGGADPRIEETALTLGASRLRAAWTVLMETRRAFLAAVATTFGRLISELGVALMVGGNIAGSTRTMTTAIALETSKGDLAFGFALGLVLLTVALGVNLCVSAIHPTR
jgi:tungstate transport system permease protein